MKTISAAELKEKAKQLRKTAVTMIYEAQSGHPGGSLSIADIVADLYFREMNVDPKNPRWEDRDRFVRIDRGIAAAAVSGQLLTIMYVIKQVTTV